MKNRARKAGDSGDDVRIVDKKFPSTVARFTGSGFDVA